MDTEQNYGRPPIEQALENARQIVRTLELALTSDASKLCPHPLFVASAETENTRRYIAEAIKALSSGVQS